MERHVTKRAGRWATAVAILGILAATPAPAQIKASVTIDAAHPGARISRYIYGQFSEHLGRSIYGGIWVGKDSKIPNVDGYRTDVLEALKKLHIPVIRWPGGCFADYYDWRDGIGPRAKRAKRVNSNWGGGIEDNAFGTHEFMNYTEMLGADAYIAGNMGSAPPRSMSDWYEYMTSDTRSTLADERRANGRDKPWKVPFFGVGNESWGCGGRMTPAYSADLTKRYSTFLRPPAGTPLVRVASGPNDDTYAGVPVKFADTALERTEVMMRDGGAGDAFDAISIHHYAFPGDWTSHGQATGFAEDAWARTLDAARYMDTLLTRHSAVMDKYDPAKRVGIVIDEWGTWYDASTEPDAGLFGEHDLYMQQNTLRDALVAALSFNIFHRHADRMLMANIAQMVNVDQAMVLTDGPRMVVTPTYHVFDMYQPFMDATFLPLKVDGPIYRVGNISMPAVDASAARGRDGKLHLALVNVDPHQSARVRVSIDGVAARGAQGRILTGPAMDTRNTFDRPNTLVPAAYSGRADGGALVFDLPAKSVAVVAVER
ncbi:MAG TPA: alpha-L-arabinofuranosidase C-terminal domain-containing protein [Sphingomonas sp.]|nr:alpha-L-arabinofuranosidase C-terminal domain-containing protein [Sphingomonas sp.]